MEVLTLSDIHAGHKCGGNGGNYEGNDSEVANQRHLHQTYLDMLGEIGSVDVALLNGDAMDGTGKRGNNKEHITKDRFEQIQIAVNVLECIKFKSRPTLLMTRGTKYHTGIEEDWEDGLRDVLLAKGWDVKLRNIYTKLMLGGVKFNMRHKIGGSTIPHGRLTSIMRAKLWNKLWSLEDDEQWDADVLIRSHVHYHVFGGDHKSLQMITPALQGLGSDYGTRECDGVVHYGMIHFTCEKGKYTWKPYVTIVGRGEAPIVR